MWKWCLNSKQAALQLRVEGSRKGERGQEKLSTPDSHVDEEKGAKTIVYNTKRDSKKREEKKNTKRKRAKRWRNTTVKKKKFYAIDHTIRAYPKMLFVFVHVYLFPFNTINQYLFPIFRLTFSPTLYKFIIRAFWAWAHSCFGFESKMVLTFIELDFINIWWIT